MKQTLYAIIAITLLVALVPVSPVYAAKNRKEKNIRITITHLDYSCWRKQSDSVNPVFIEKRKPVIDLLLKINRCFVDVSGYSNPVFTITYRFMDTAGRKHTEEISRKNWIDLNTGCYTSTKEFSHFAETRCN